MFNIPFEAPLYIIPNVLDDGSIDTTKSFIDNVIDGKTIPGVRKAQRTGFKTLGYAGPFQRHTLPPELQSLCDTILCFLKTNRSALPSDLTEGVDDTFVFNQVDVVKLAAGNGYSLAVEGEQESQGPIVTVIVDGHCPFTIKNNAAPGDAVKIFGTDEALETPPFTNPSNEYQSVLVTLPPKSLSFFSPSFVSKLSREITPRVTQDRSLPLPRLPSSQTPLLITTPLHLTFPTPSADDADGAEVTLESVTTEGAKPSKPRKAKQLSPIFGVPGLTLYESEEHIRARALAADTDVAVNSRGHLRGAGIVPVKRDDLYALTLRCFRKHTAAATASAQPRKAVVSASVGLELEALAESKAAAFERAHVHKVYDAIARHFSGTRYQAWPHVDRFVMELPAGSLLGDIGCGNGKYLGLNKAVVGVGCDVSEGLARIAHGRGCSVVVGDCLSVPFKSECFDNCICIAVLHHMSTEQRRKRALAELVRVTRPGGRVLVTAWALEQEGDARRVFEGADVWVPFKTPSNVKKELASAEEKERERVAQRKVKTLVEKPACVSSNAGGEEAVAAPEVAIPAETRAEETSLAAHTGPVLEDPAADTPNLPPAEDCARFYHVFRQGEMEELVDSLRADGVPVETDQVFYDKGNWCIILKRLHSNK